VSHSPETIVQRWNFSREYPAIEPFGLTTSPASSPRAAATVTVAVAVAVTGAASLAGAVCRCSSQPIRITSATVVMVAIVDFRIRARSAGSSPGERGWVIMPAPRKTRASPTGVLGHQSRTRVSNVQRIFSAT
jgi:hypothetical protein